MPEQEPEISTTDIDWDYVRSILDSEQWEPDPDNPDQEMRCTFLGTVFALFPSGKYYMPWACSNVTEEEAEADEIYQEALEAEANAHNLGIFSGEGDPCDIFAGEWRATADKEDSEEHDPTRSDPDYA